VSKFLYEVPEIVQRKKRRRRGTSWRALRKKVMRRDGYRCVRCGATEDLTLDHVIPRSKLGPDGLENLQTLCRSCNEAKADA
jgi:5-methylcytosine-specific restriction endonuclease McrA